MARRRDREDPEPELTEEQEYEFTVPMDAVLARQFDDSAFPSESAKREAWHRYGERITHEFVAENPGERPPAWWEFELSRLDSPSVYAGDIPGVDSLEEFRERYPGWSVSAAYLHEAGLLSDAERAALPPLEDPGPGERAGLRLGGGVPTRSDNGGPTPPTTPGA